LSIAEGEACSIRYASFGVAIGAEGDDLYKVGWVRQHVERMK
jgi:hypothetical protein